jgi:hypothetical protein
MSAFLRVVSFLLAVNVGLTALGQRQFHWQWRKMQEDHFSQRPIIRQMKASQNFRIALTEAVVRSMRADKDVFGDVPNAELWVLASNESYEWVDLDGDGIPELVTGGFGVDQCGGTGNCILQVFRRNGSKFDLILYSREEQIMIDRSGPKPLLMLYTHSSAIEGDLEVYAFPQCQKAKLVYSYDVWWGGPAGGAAYKSPRLEPAKRH